MKIKQKIALAFLLIGVLPALFVGLINISNMKSLLEESGKNTVKSIAGLENIAKFKSDRLESIFIDIKSQARVLQDSVAIKDNFPTIVKFVDDRGNIKYIQAKNAMDDRLKSWMKTQVWISDILLVNSDGIVVYAFDPEHFRKELGGMLPDIAVFEKGKENISVGEIFIHKEDATSHPGMLVAAALKDHRGSFVGEIILSIKMAPLYDLIQDLTGMGKTGETVIAKKVGNDALFLNPLRFDKDATLIRKVTIGSSLGTASQKSVIGENGSGYSIDYRGHDSLGAWRYLPSLDWGIVVKIDKQEVFSELNDFRNFNFIILIILAFISVAIALYFAKSISDPINSLAKAVNDISRGKLDVKLEKLEGKDEVAELSRAFERTIVSLKLAMKEIAEKKQGEDKK